MALTELNFSARAYDKILKVSRTIADLAESEGVSSRHFLHKNKYLSLSTCADLACLSI